MFTVYVTFRKPEFQKSGIPESFPWSKWKKNRTQTVTRNSVENTILIAIQYYKCLMNFCFSKILFFISNKMFPIIHIFNYKMFSVIHKNSIYIKTCLINTVAEFKEFERRFKFKPRFKYGWFHLKLNQMFQDLSRRLI